ncbi:MAG: isochorismatase family protein [Candidatus Tectomicrobia bacterium]|nr:isochorismatase family protein [Candidatus Tectomicrobia bacterium]
MELSEAEQYYANIGFADRVGFGERPALLIIDCNHGCADPSISPIGIAMDDELAHIRRLLDVSRSRQIPVVHTTVVYREGQLRDGGWFVTKVPALAALKPDTKEVQIVPQLAPQPGELVIEKSFPSGFSGTNLHAYLTRCQVDTVVVTGNSTSGCVRATVVDAVSAGFRVIVPRQCVADRVPLTHMVNLFDIDSKYGDVMDVEDVLAALRGKGTT